MAILKACTRAATTIEVLEKNGVEFTDVEKIAIVKAFSSRGPYKEYLKKTKPNANKEPLTAAAWLAMQPNNYKISITALLMLCGEEAELFNKLTIAKDGSAIRYPDCFDKDKETLKNCGVW